MNTSWFGVVVGQGLAQRDQQQNRLLGALGGCPSPTQPSFPWLESLRRPCRCDSDAHNLASDIYLSRGRHCMRPPRRRHTGTVPLRSAGRFCRDPYPSFAIIDCQEGAYHGRTQRRSERRSTGEGQASRENKEGRVKNGAGTRTSGRVRAPGTSKDRARIRRSLGRRRRIPAASTRRLVDAGSRRFDASNCRLARAGQ